MNITKASPKIDFFASRREWLTHQDLFLGAMKKSMSGGQFLQGKEVLELEKQMATLAQRRFGVAVNSCTDALYFALVAAGLKPGDQVLVTDFSFIASASCIVRAGATPIFVDIENNYIMDLKKAKALLTPEVKALVYVHLYGQMTAPVIVEKFCRDHNLILIEDAAQAIGANWNGRAAGSIGVASCISFDPTKPISAPGSGGIVLTDDENMAKHVERLRYHGRGENKKEFVELGFNSQMPTATAAVLLEKLKFNQEWIKRRRAIADQLIDGLSTTGDLILPKEINLNSHIYHKFVLRTSRRDALKKWLDELEIETMIHYAHPLHRQPYFSNQGQDERFPNSCIFAEQVLSLPMHPFLSSEEVQRMILRIQLFFSTHKE